MPISFDDEHIKRNVDKVKNSDTTKFNGGIDGHSAKWDERNRPKTSTDAGLGWKASRNQGTGEQGKINREPGEVRSLKDMDPDEKFRYLKALGMLSTDEPEVKQDVVSEPVQKNPVQSNRPVRRSVVQRKP